MMLVRHKPVAKTWTWISYRELYICGGTIRTDQSSKDEPVILAQTTDISSSHDETKQNCNYGKGEKDAVGRKQRGCERGGHAGDVLLACRKAVESCSCGALTGYMACMIRGGCQGIVLKSGNSRCCVAIPLRGPRGRGDRVQQANKARSRRKKRGGRIKLVVGQALAREAPRVGD